SPSGIRRAICAASSTGNIVSICASFSAITYPVRLTSSVNFFGRLPQDNTRLEFGEKFRQYCGRRVVLRGPFRRSKNESLRKSLVSGGYVCRCAQATCSGVVPVRERELLSWPYTTTMKGRLGLHIGK